MMKKFIYFFKKHSIKIYVLCILFSIFFFILLLGASGHRYHYNPSDKYIFSFIISGILIVPIHDDKRIKNRFLKLFIQILALITAIGTLIVGISLLKENFEFEYDKNMNPIINGIFYLVPLIFILANGLIVIDIIKCLRK